MIYVWYFPMKDKIIILNRQQSFETVLDYTIKILDNTKLLDTAPILIGQL